MFEAILAVAALVQGGDSAWRAALRSRIDSLDRVMIERRGDRSRDAGPTARLAAGSLTLTLPADDSAATVPWLGQIAEEWDQLFAGTAPVVSLRLAPVEGGAVIASGADAAGQVLGSAEVRRRRWADPRAVYRALWDVLGDVLLVQAPPLVATWAGVAPIARLELLDRASLRYQWATATGPASRRCRDGDRAGCVAALGLAPIQGKELSLGLRQAFLATVLDAGGSGAWSRLADSSDRPMAGRLSSAAGGDLAPVLDRWRAGMLAESRGLEGPGRLGVGLLWVAATFAVALRRGMRR